MMLMHQILITVMGTVTIMITLTRQGGCDATGFKKMQNASSEYKLRRELLTSYDRFVRPVLSPLTVVNISFFVKLINVVDVDSKKEIITSKVLIEQAWENPYLKWDQSLFEGINRVRMDSKEVWVPDIRLQNSASNPSLDVQYHYQNWVTVYSNGTNVWVSIAMLDSKCDFDISVFPFDEQKCRLVFSSESYDIESLDIHLKPGAPNSWDEGKYIKSTSNGEWQTGGLRVSRYEEISPCCSTPFARIKFNFTITRIPTFYILYLLCPIVVLTLLVFFSFIIPPDNGERIGFSSSLLLSLSVYLLLFSDLMPNNSRNLNIFGVTFVLIFLEAASVLLATLLVLKAYHATGEIPAVLKFFCCRSFALCSFKRNNYPLNEATKNQIPTRSSTMKEEEPSTSITDGISLSNLDQETREQQQEILDQEPNQLNWLQIAHRLDRFFFWFFLFVFILVVTIIAGIGPNIGQVEIGV